MPMSPSDAIYAKVVARDPDQPEFHQAVKEVLESLEPVLALSQLLAPLLAPLLARVHASLLGGGRRQ